MIVVVTGVLGFVGCRLAQTLCKAGHTVFGIDKCRETGDAIELRAFSRYNFIQVDLSKDFFPITDFDVLIHAAGCSPAPEVSVEDYILGNVSTTQNLIKITAKENIKLFIYLSSVSIYGKIKSSPVQEQNSIQNPSIYGLTKYLAELLLQDHKDKVPSIILRLPSIVGKGMKTGWFFLTSSKIERGENLTIYNENSPYNMLHISDLCVLICSVLNRQFSGNNIFNLNCSSVLSIRQIVEIMKENMNSNSEIFESQTNDRGYILSIKRAKKVLEFKPRSAEAVVRDYLGESTSRFTT